MINFKQFLSEVRAAPLYHGTPMSALSSIILDKQGISPRTSHRERELLRGNKQNDVRGVSASRSFHYAAKYRGNNAVIELDQSKLVHRYKIVPIQFWQDLQTNRPARIKGDLFRRDGGPIKSNEFEEFIITDKPIPIQFIKHVYVEKRFLDNHGTSIKMMKEISDKYGRDFIRIYDANFNPIMR